MIKEKENLVRDTNEKKEVHGGVWVKQIQLVKDTSKEGEKQWQKS